jgi:predicted dehydrogenase
MNESGQLRWGVVGAANIARSQFLPALCKAGGVGAAVASRELANATEFARDNEIERAVAGYDTLINDPSIDAIYIPLPNALHAEWTIRALEAGKPALCEKPLCGMLADTERVLAVAER